MADGETTEEFKAQVPGGRYAIGQVKISGF